MIEDVQGLKSVPISLSGGIDEISPSDSLAVGDCVKMTNWRLTKDGKRIQKRAGLQEEGLVSAADDVYGYATYIDVNAKFCQLAVLEGQLMRKVDTAAWAQIYDWPAAATIDHTVKPLEIQGKQFVITEKGSCVIQADGGVRQIGISPPLTLPTLAANYVTTAPFCVNETFSTYANTAALDAVWTDDDAGGGISTLEAADPYTTPGPDADTHYVKFSAPAGSTYAKRWKASTVDIGSVYSINFATYFKTLNAFHSLLGRHNGFRVAIYNGAFLVELHICKDGIFLTGNNNIPRRISSEVTPLEKWITWNVSVDGSDHQKIIVIVHRNIGGTLTSVTIDNHYHPDTNFINNVVVELSSRAAIDSQEAWLDFIKVVPVDEDSAVITGVYRYAVSFVRTGNYGCESKPIKSIIGTVTFSVAPGLNDMTISAESTYTGSQNKTIRVYVKTAASPQDTIQWSDDGGLTWKGEIKLSTKIYLGYGITVNFAAITGHTATNYWDIPCSACSVVATGQQVTVSSIPGPGLGAQPADTQVTARKIYRTDAGGSKYYYLTTIYDGNVTTQFIDNFPDTGGLGEEMEEDRDLFTEATVGTGGAVSTTIGKFSEWWDNRLWIADHVQNVVYYSAVRSGGGVPEEFDVVGRFIPIRKGDQGDVITAMKAYKDALYVFKRNDIFIIQKTTLGYAPFHLNADVGCIADNCVEVVNDFLMFPSERGIEVHDGARTYSPDFSVAINKTFLTADPAYYKFMTIAHDKEYNEAWLSIPGRLSGAAAITIVWNYIKNKFFFFQFYKTPSCLVSCKDSTGKRVLKMGTRDGYLLLCDYGTADHTTAITATYRKGWLDMDAHGISRLLRTKYELPATKTITANIYVNMDKDVFRTAALTGVTPSATDIDLRRIIGDKSELGTRHRWIAVEYVNAEDCGGDCKINEASILVRPDVIKRKTFAD
jgi:hypothetical protein